jgi:DNA-binding transcriptional ArsR family regulator
VTALLQATRAERPALDTRTVKAVAHPSRVRVLAHLHEHGPASPNELASIFRVALGTMSYHVRRLQELGFVELVRTTPRRGAIQHHYALAADAAVRLRGIAEFVTHGDDGS